MPWDVPGCPRISIGDGDGVGFGDVPGLLLAILDNPRVRACEWSMQQSRVAYEYSQVVYKCARACVR